MGFRRQANKLVTLLPEWTWNYSKRKPITSYNPKREEVRQEDITPVYHLFNYDVAAFSEKKVSHAEACAIKPEQDQIIWINIDGLRKTEVEKLCNCYNIHNLVIEDILSVGQRAKMDEVEEIMFCLLPMLYYNEGTGQIETEQVSIVLGRGFVLSFQEDPLRDVFNPVRDRLRVSGSKVRQRTADYLCYSLIDIIVDSYFEVIEKTNERIERLEDGLLLQKENGALAKISILRREVMLLRRSILPVRDLVNGFLKSENHILEDRHDKYYKDVLDHIIQANEFVENQREMLMNLQDLSMSQINIRMNEVMKLFTMVATLLAPATVIGGIFGMNFDVIPLSHHGSGFYFAVAIMLIVPVFMLIWFKKKGWF
ncbi:MAG TPA: magnesium/cobalt transporter CorA [Flavipsychrobacter sp.]|nr:magnesium/cobalt transporter CorA [Flavipsychrobacter sp.]